MLRHLLSSFLTLLLTTTTGVSTYSILPQRASYFVGRDVDVYSSTKANANRRKSTSAGKMIEMKKGKSNVSPQMRQQYKRAQEMEGYRKQMVDSQVRCFRKVVIEYEYNLLH